MAEGDGGGAKDGSVPLEGLEGSLDDIIALCHRNSQNLNQQQREVRGQGSAQRPGSLHLVPVEREVRGQPRERLSPR